MKRENFKNIQTLAQLESARLTVAKSLNRRRRAIGQDCERIQNAFKPARLIDAGWQLVVPNARPLSQILLGAVRTAKSFLLKI